MIFIKKIVLILVFLGYSCNKEPGSKINYGKPLHTITFDFEKDQKNSKEFLSLIDSISVIKLETNMDCLIGEISKIDCDDDFIYVLDERKSRALFKFTKSGKFISTISEIGRGPGEFNRPTDFFLLNDQIVILDGYCAKIMYFSKNGDFIKEFSTKTTAENFVRIDDNHFGMLNNHNTSHFTDYNISIIDNKGKTIKEFMKTPKYSENKNFYLNKATTYFGKEPLYTDLFNSNIFSVKKDSFYVKYRLDFGENSASESFLMANKKLNAVELLRTLNENNFVNDLDYFSENSKYISFTCTKNHTGIQVFYDKEEKIPYIFDIRLFPEWLGFMIDRPYVYSDENMSISVFSPSLSEFIKGKYLKDISENSIFSKLKPIINKTNVSDNPSLIMTYLKK